MTTDSFVKYTLLDDYAYMFDELSENTVFIPSISPYDLIIDPEIEFGWSMDTISGSEIDYLAITRECS